MGLPPTGAVYQLKVAPEVLEEAPKVSVPGPQREAPVPTATGPALMVAITGTRSPSQPLLTADT